MLIIEAFAHKMVINPALHGAHAADAKAAIAQPFS
jgi:hypothetical protein